MIGYANRMTMRVRILAIFALFAALAGSVLLPATARAAHGPENTPLFAESCLLAGPARLDFAQAARRTDWNCAPSFRDAKERYVWLRLDGAQLAQGELTLSGMSAPFEAIHLVAELEDGRTIRQDYDEATIRRNWSPTNYYSLPLDFTPARVRTFYLGVDRPQSHLLVTEFRLQHKAAAFAEKVSLSVLFALCVGMLLIVALLSAAMARIIHNRVAALHTVFTLLVTTYVFSASSLIFLLLPELSLWGRSFVNYASLALAFTVMGPIILSYLERDAIPPFLRKALWFSIACTLAAVFVLPLGLIVEFDTRATYHLLYLPGTVTILAIAVAAARRGSQAIKGFALAWFAPILFGIERALRGADFYYLPISFDHLFYIGLAIQAVVMTIAIAQQAQRLRLERDAERRAAKSALSSALTDPLTDLPNRRDFESFDWSAASYLGILDLDRFKAINDVHGHDTGDEVLKAVAGVLQPSREYGLLRAWRMGGEEFAVALDGPSIESAAIAFNRIRSQIGVAVAEAVPQLPVKVSASAGITELGAEPRQSYRAADTALYRAKGAGRDKLCFETEGGEFTTLFRAATRKRAAA